MGSATGSPGLIYDKPDEEDFSLQIEDKPATVIARQETSEYHRPAHSIFTCSLANDLQVRNENLRPNDGP